MNYIKNFHNNHKHESVILVISVILSTLIFIFGQICYFGDSGTYLQLANGFNPHLFWRPPGYPFLLKITGYTLEGSLIGILILQAILAVFIPVIIYKLTKYFTGSRIAFIFALLIAISLLPFFFQQTIYPDQVQIFLIVLFSVLMVRFNEFGERLILFIICVVLFIATFLRPTLQLMWLIPVLVLLTSFFVDSKKLISKFRWINFIILTVAIISTLWISLTIERNRLDVKTNTDIERSINGRQIFLNIYLNSYGLDINSRSLGASSSELREHLLNYFEKKDSRLDLKNFGNIDEVTYKRLFGDFNEDPSLQVAEIFDKPNITYFWFLFAFADSIIVNGGDSLFMSVSREMIIEHPVILLRLLKINIIGYFWGPPHTFNAGYSPDNLQIEDVNFLPLEPMVQAIEPWLSESTKFLLKSNLERKYVSSAFAKIFHSIWGSLYLLFMRLSLLTIVAFGVVLVLNKLFGKRQYRFNKLLSFSLLLVILFFQVIPLIVLVNPQLRYHMVSALLMLTCGFIAGNYLRAYLFDERFNDNGEIIT
jgi:hypothetical protein